MLCHPTLAARHLRLSTRWRDVETRLDGSRSVLATTIAAVALTTWQVRVDRSIFEPFFGALSPVGVMAGVAIVGAIAMAPCKAPRLRDGGPGRREGRGPGHRLGSPAATAAAAIGADLLVRYPEDTNVAMPDALRVLPPRSPCCRRARSVHVTDRRIHRVVLGMPTGSDSTFWRIAVPVALVEAVMQAVYATSVGTSVFSAVHGEIVRRDRCAPTHRSRGPNSSNGSQWLPTDRIGGPPAWPRRPSIQTSWSDSAPRYLSG